MLVDHATPAVNEFEPELGRTKGRRSGGPFGKIPTGMIRSDWPLNTNALVYVAWRSTFGGKFAGRARAFKNATGMGRRQVQTAIKTAIERGYIERTARGPHVTERLTERNPDKYVIVERSIFDGPASVDAIAAHLIVKSSQWVAKLTTIQSAFGCNEKTARRIVREAIDAGLLTREIVRNGNRHGDTVYRADPEQKAPECKPKENAAKARKSGALRSVKSHPVLRSVSLSPVKSGPHTKECFRDEELFLEKDTKQCSDTAGLDLKNELGSEGVDTDAVIARIETADPTKIIDRKLFQGRHRKALEKLLTDDPDRAETVASIIVRWLIEHPKAAPGEVFAWKYFKDRIDDRIKIGERMRGHALRALEAADARAAKGIPEEPNRFEVMLNDIDANGIGESPTAKRYEAIFEAAQAKAKAKAKAKSDAIVADIERRTGIRVDLSAPLAQSDVEMIVLADFQCRQKNGRIMLVDPRIYEHKIVIEPLTPEQIQAGISGLIRRGLLSTTNSFRLSEMRYVVTPEGMAHAFVAAPKAAPARSFNLLPPLPGTMTKSRLQASVRRSDANYAADERPLVSFGEERKTSGGWVKLGGST